MNAVHTGVTWLALALFGAFPQFSLTDTAGRIHQTADWNNVKAVVIFFTTVDCPLSNGYIPEMNRISRDYGSRGIAFYAVQTDTTIPEAEVVQHTKEFGFEFPVLLDPKQILVKHTGAIVTPEVAVLSKSGEVSYLGRIDNRIVDFDQRRPAATAFDLKDALEAVLSGRKPAEPRTTAVGCGINFVRDEGNR